MEIVYKPKARQTKYVTAVYEVLRELNHATNLELLQHVQLIYPEVSATTIHRVTARLKERGIIGRAPKPADGSERYDISTAPHHHFMCSNCSGICDMPETEEASRVVSQLKNLSRQCAFAGTLTLSGICIKCKGEDKA